MEKLVVPALERIGAGWEQGRVALSQVYMSGRICEELVDTLLIGASSLEDLAEVKAACRGRLTVLGNLNGIEMRRWMPEQAEAAVKTAIAKAGPGGGFILSDNHGEIPWQVPEEALLAVSEAVHTWGNYPLDWVKDDG